MLCWGVQAYFMKSANNSMSAESIFFYMMIAGLLLVPVAWLLTDRSQPVNWGWDGPALAAGIQILNAIGALTLVYAFRYGKAIIVAPLTNAGAPLATAVISLIALGIMPGPLKIIGLVLALAASVLLAIEPDAADDAVAGRSLTRSSRNISLCIVFLRFVSISPYHDCNAKEQACKSSATSSPGTRWASASASHPSAPPIRW